MSFPLQCTVPAAAEPVSLATAHLQLRLDPGFTQDDPLIAQLISTAREMVELQTGRALMPQTWLLATDWFPVYRWWDYAPSRSDYDALGNYNFMGYRWNHSQTIAVPRPPLIAVQSLTYVSPVDGSTQSVPLSGIQVDTFSQPGRILPAYGQYWPQVQPQANAVQLTFQAGYLQRSAGVLVNAGGQPTVQLGSSATFYALTSLARQDGNPLGAYTVSADGLLTLAAADQSANLLASFTSTAVPFWAQQAILLMVSAWYENRSEFTLGGGAVSRLPEGAQNLILNNRTEMFGYVGRG